MSNGTDQHALDTTTDTSGLAGHPRGLTTLFFTEMWERFSYYGMRAILLLYMTKTIAEGGLQLDTKWSGLIVGTYTSGVYWTPLIGGWLADKLLGARRAVLIGGIIIASGHFSMAISTKANFYGGLALIALGTGLLKPNISTMVGGLYSQGDARRDSGFSIFYMGINLGALIAPLVCGILAEKIDWHYGFAAAGVGMVLGLIQYVLGGKRLGDVGRRPKPEPQLADGGRDLLTAPLALIGAPLGFILGYKLGGYGWVSGIFPTVVGFFAGYIIGTMRFLTGAEAKRVAVIFILFVFSIVFWMSFEQASTSLTLFADRLTRTEIFGWHFPSSWFQSVEPLFVFACSPIAAFLWLRLNKRQPSSPGKFALGLLFAGFAFAVIAFASTLTGLGKVSPLWLTGVYFLQAVGEVCLSPVGLSTVTKLAPARMVGLMMGVWFLSLSIGNFIAGQLGGQFDENANGALLRLFGVVAAISLLSAALLFFLVPGIRRMAPEAE